MAKKPREYESFADLLTPTSHPDNPEPAAPQANENRHLDYVDGLAYYVNHRSGNLDSKTYLPLNKIEDYYNHNYNLLERALTKNDGHAKDFATNLKALHGHLRELRSRDSSQENVLTRLIDAAQSGDGPYAQFYFANTSDRYEVVDPCKEAMHTVKEAVTPGYQEAKVGPMMAFLKRMLAVIERVLQVIFPSPKTVGEAIKVSAKSIAPGQENETPRSGAASKTVDQKVENQRSPQ